MPVLEEVKSLMGNAPEHVAADDGFASEKNAEIAKELVVKEIAFGGKLKNELTRWVSSARVQKKLRRFRER